MLLLFTIYSENSKLLKKCKDKSSAEKPKLTNYVIWLLLSCIFVNIFSETAKINQYSQCLHGLPTQLWDAIFYLFEVLVLANRIAIS